MLDILGKKLSIESNLKLMADAGSGSGKKQGPPQGQGNNGQNGTEQGRPAPTQGTDGKWYANGHELTEEEVNEFKKSTSDEASKTKSSPDEAGKTKSSPDEASKTKSTSTNTSGNYSDAGNKNSSTGGGSSSGGGSTSGGGSSADGGSGSGGKSMLDDLIDSWEERITDYNEWENYEYKSLTYATFRAKFQKLGAAVSAISSLYSSQYPMVRNLKTQYDNTKNELESCSQTCDSIKSDLSTAQSDYESSIISNGSAVPSNGKPSDISSDVSKTQTTISSLESYCDICSKKAENLSDDMTTVEQGYKSLQSDWQDLQFSRYSLYCINKGTYPIIDVTFEQFWDRYCI